MSSTHRLWDPVGLAVVCNEFVAEGLHLDKPARDRAVDKRRVGAPAEGIGEVVDAFACEAAGCAEDFDDLFVSGLDVETRLAACEKRLFCSTSPIFVPSLSG